MTSLHPKLSAILALIVLLANAAKAMFDGDPATNPDWASLVAAAVMCYGLFSARQNNTTSEMVQGLPPAKPMGPPGTNG